MAPKSIAREGEQVATSKNYYFDLYISRIRWAVLPVLTDPDSQLHNQS